MNTILLKQQ